MEVSQRKVVGTLAALMLLGGVLRAWPIASRPLWHDEVMTWVAVQKGLWAILTWQHHYEHPPLSYLLVWMSSRAFSTDAAWALRLPSLVCGLLAIPAVFMLGRALMGQVAGLLAAAIVALDANQIIQSQQARMYTLTVLTTVGTLWAVAQAMRGCVTAAGDHRTGALGPPSPLPSPGWRGDVCASSPGASRRLWAWSLAGVGLAAAYAASHMGSFVWLAVPLGLGLWMLWRGEDSQPSRAGGRVAVGLAVAYGAAIALCSVGFYVMATRGAWFRDKSGTEPLITRLSGLWNDFWNAYGHPAPALLMLALGGLGLVVLMRRNRSMGLVLAFLVLVNAVLVLPVMPHNFEARPRYVIIGQVSLWIGAAALLVSLRPWVVRWAGIAAVGGLVVWTGLLSVTHGETADYALGRAVLGIREDAAPDDQVVCYPAWIESVPWYYGLPPTHAAGPNEFGWGESQYAKYTLAEIDTERPTWLISAYFRTGAGAWVPRKMQDIADYYGVAVDETAAAEFVRGHAVVVARISQSGVELTGYGGEARR